LIGLVLGAGRGSRLGLLSAECPKPLIRVDDQRTILDVTLGNFADLDISHVVVVAGYLITRLMDEAPRLERRYGVDLTIVANPYFATRNNCFSLLCARPWFGEEILLANGDTLHHVDVDRLLLQDRSESAIVLAVQRDRKMADEEMKVAVDEEGFVTELGKGIDPEEAYGEYIGVALLRPAAESGLAASLIDVVERAPHLYYEDAFTHFAQGGGPVSVVEIGDLPWQEVDTETDLEEARGLACLC
jgi:choline kinase